MKSNMHKRKQIVRKFLSLFSLALVISATIYAVQAYSVSIGLFNDFDIQISGNNYIDTALIEDEIYPLMSSSLLSINLTAIQDKLESLDFIEAVLASRILPHTLIIHIVERSPILLINIADKITFMDNKGTLLPANEKSIGIFPVPVLSILDDNESIDKYLGNISQFFLFLLAEYPIFYKNLSEVKIQAGVWEFYSDNNTKIYAHVSYLISQLNILKYFEKTVHPMRDLQHYRYIDLRIKDQVIVKEKYRKG